MNMKTQWKPAGVLGKAAMACAVVLSALPAYAQTNNIPNRLIDYDTFLAQAADVGRLRSERRVTEDQFIEMAAEPGTVVFDARSDDKYAGLHIKGAKHLSFPEITADELTKVFRSKSTRILIYCNNNFLNAPNTFATKAPTASLNIHTFNTLYSYGYTNVYELGPLIDVRKAKLRFEGTQLEKP
jgi:phage shock protein E